MEHEIWLTVLFNKFLAGPANVVLSWAGVHPENPAHPWTNFVTMEIFVAALIIVTFGLLRPRLSMDRPGQFQHTFEIMYNFIHGQTEDVAGHRALRYLEFFGVIFIFILFANLIGLVPTLESPTMFAAVPLGCAIAVFFHFNYVGVREQGLLTYLKHFTGPMPALAPLMFPIEIISSLARPLSLTVRLYANMFAGEQVTMAFMGLIPIILPMPFMALHIFVGLLQAYVFALLAMVYVSDVMPHEH